MKRFFAVFWIIYAFFFAVPFPMFLYYMIKSENPLDLKGSNPWFSLGVLIVSIVLWSILLISLYKNSVLRVFSTKRNIKRLKKTGIPREAKIINTINLSKPNVGYDTYELTLSFKNLVDVEIQHKAAVNDKRPHEYRFVTGKKVDLLIDNDMKRIPYFIFSSMEVSVKTIRVSLINLGWLALVALVIAYYIYAYQSESEGMGWRFMSLVHPLVICPASLLLETMFIRFIYKKINGSPDNLALIKFKGIETTAKLINASQTGTYINEQPMINFELEYTDYLQQTHRTNLKKIVNLLDLDSTKQQSVSIFYLKENPKIFAFSSDLNHLR